MSHRRIAFGGSEQRTRTLTAKHIHHSGGISYYGDGKVVMVETRSAPLVVHVIGEDGRDAWGESFVYADYFLPEDIKNPGMQRSERDRTGGTESSESTRAGADGATDHRQRPAEINSTLPPVVR